MICVVTLCQFDFTKENGYEMWGGSFKCGYILQLKGLLQNGSIFRYPTYISRHFHF